MSIYLASLFSNLEVIVSLQPKYPAYNFQEFEHHMQIKYFHSKVHVRLITVEYRID